MHKRPISNRELQVMMGLALRSLNDSEQLIVRKSELQNIDLDSLPRRIGLNIQHTTFGRGKTSLNISVTNPELFESVREGFSKHNGKEQLV